MKKLLNTLYVTSENSYLGLDGENIVVFEDNKEKGRLPLHNLEGIVSFGYRGVSPALMGACAERNISLCFMTPQGKPFSQKLAEEYAKEEDLIFLCGHYEGIDQRVLDLIVTDEVSAGDFVLTGGELPAMMMIDCISRLVPGVLNNEASAQDESFEGNLLEYPQYTRPEVFMGESVPPVLLSGHHGNIDKWRREQSILRTAKKRPDLLKNAELTQKEKNWLREQLIKKNKKAEKTLDN